MDENISLSKVLISKKFYLASFLVVLAATANFLSSSAIAKYFADRPAFMPDLFFKLTPYVGWTQYLTDIANVFSVIVLLIYIFDGRLKRMPYCLTAFGAMFLLRSVFIILTPMGGPLGNGAFYGLTKIHQYGEFPSGHTALVFLCLFLVNQKESPKIKLLLLSSVIVEIVSLILSRGHYSIDIVGGFLIAYLAYNEVKKFQDKLLIENKNV